MFDRAAAKELARQRMAHVRDIAALLVRLRAASLECAVVGPDGLRWGAVYLPAVAPVDDRLLSELQRRDLYRLGSVPDCGFVLLGAP